MDEERQALYKKLKTAFAGQELTLSQLGRDSATPDIDKESGTWANRGLYAKTPRFIIQLRLTEQGNLEAGQFHTNSTSGRLGYLNTSNLQNRVGGVYVRVHPVVILPNGEFDAIPGWEWLLLLVFSSPISGGGSSDTLDNFFPPNKEIFWKSREITKSLSLKGASLFSLTPSSTTYEFPESDPVRNMTYEEATTAIQTYLTFDF